MIWIRRVFFALVASAILQTLYYYPQMPDIVASHWDGLGAPNGWSSRNGFFGLYLGIVAMLVAAFVYLPRWSLNRGRKGLNLPNADYWLAPERIEQTRAIIQDQLLIMGVVHLALAVVVMQLAIQANFEPGASLDSSILWILILYFIILAVWLARFFLRFRKP